MRPGICWTPSDGAGRRILFEGAQGALLDVDHGTYPFVTSSNTGLPPMRRPAPAWDRGRSAMCSASPKPYDARRRRPLPDRASRRDRAEDRRAGTGIRHCDRPAAALRLVRRRPDAADRQDVRHRWYRSDQARYSRRFRVDSRVYPLHPRRHRDRSAAGEPGWRRRASKPVYETIEGWQGDDAGVPARGPSCRRRRSHMCAASKKLIGAPVALAVYESGARRYDSRSQSVSGLGAGMKAVRPTGMNREMVRICKWLNTYPLLVRAVAALPNGTPEARRKIYERARQALVGQLRKDRSAVPEADIERETWALDDCRRQAGSRTDREGRWGLCRRPSLRLRQRLHHCRPLRSRRQPSLWRRRVRSGPSRPDRASNNLLAPPLGRLADGTPPNVPQQPTAAAVGAAPRSTARACHRRKCGWYPARGRRVQWRRWSRPRSASRVGVLTCRHRSERRSRKPHRLASRPLAKCACQPTSLSAPQIGRTLPRRCRRRHPKRWTGAASAARAMMRQRPRGQSSRRM